MRQKYVLVKNDRDQVLTVKEYAELEKELMSLMCEETYSFELIEPALSRGKEALIYALRTKNLYPPSIYAEKISASVIELFRGKGEETLELFFDDSELLTQERKSAEIIDEAGKDPDDIDALLEDEDDLLDPDKDPIVDSGSSIKIEDEE